jgi:hypothetical protein
LLFETHVQSTFLFQLWQEVVDVNNQWHHVDFIGARGLDQNIVVREILKWCFLVLRWLIFMAASCTSS